MFTLHKQWLGKEGYRPIELLGTGSFSSVYAVEDMKLKCTKAVKIIESQKFLNGSSYTEQNSKFIDFCKEFKSMMEVRRKKLKENKTGLKYFNREIITLRRLMQSYHPFIVKIYSIKCTFLVTYIFMEHLTNGNLNDYLNRNGPLEPDDDLAKLWIFQLASALKHLHSISIAHRDVKLQNIGLDSQMNAKLIDFGFACQCVIKKVSNNSEQMDTKDQPNESLTKQWNSNYRSMDSYLGASRKYFNRQSSFLNNEKLNSTINQDRSDQQVEHVIQLSNSQCGTPIYLAPEVIIADKCAYDPRKADIWSLGVTMFAIISYRYPFTKRDYKVLYKQHLKRTWMSKRVYTCFSEDAFDLIKNMLEPIPKKRYTADEILNHNWITKFRKRKLKKSEDLNSSKARRSSDEKLSTCEDNELFNQQSNELANEFKIEEINPSVESDDQSGNASIISYESNQISQSILSVHSGLESQSCIT